MEDFPTVNSVRAIIDLFEDNCRNATSSRLNRNMSKSFAGLSFTERKHKLISSSGNDVLYHLDQRLTSLSLRLREYKVYSKEIHVAIQEELIEIMKLLINTDTKNNTLMYRKKELMYDIQARFNELSTRLPDSSGNIRQGFGDSSYKPFSWKRPNSVAGGRLNTRDSTEKDNLLVSPRGAKPQRTQSVIERYVNSIQQSSRNDSSKYDVPRRGLEIPGRYTNGSELTVNSNNSYQESSDFVIGGTGGIRRTVNSSDWRSKVSASKEKAGLEPLRSRDSVLTSSPVEQSSDDVIGGAAGIRRSENSSDTMKSTTLESEGVIYESLTSPSSLKQSPDFVIGGQSGIRRTVNSSDYNTATSEGISPSSLGKSSDYIIGGQAGIQRAANLDHVDSTGAIYPPGSDDNIQIRPKHSQERSTEAIQGNDVKKPATIGRSESAKSWTYGELRGRRRPVSLGGTVVTLNSPEDIISSMKFSRELSQPSGKGSGSPVAEDDKQQFMNQEEVVTETQDWSGGIEDNNNLQSVNILKRFFELKSDERKKLETQKSFNAKEDQREDFQKYVESMERSFQDGDDQNTLTTEDNTDRSSNNTIVEVEVEEDELGGSKRVLLTRASSILVDEVEGLNCPVLRTEEMIEVDEVVTSSVLEDAEEVGSLTSEQSIYLDPVD